MPSTRVVSKMDAMAKVRMGFLHSSPTQPKDMASQNGFNGATALPLSCGKYVGFFSPRTLLAETPLADWAERIRTSKRQFDEVLGTSAEFSCTAEAIC